jgi:hypothetical protein
MALMAALAPAWPSAGCGDPAGHIHFGDPALMLRFGEGSPNKLHS